MINNIALRYFVGVVRAGSIRRAADRLHIAASAISRQMQLLEDELGTQLFERHRGQKALKLTPEGEVVLEYARLMENELDQVRADIRSIHLLERGTVRLGISESFTRAFLPEFLKQFHAEYPGITFEVVVGAGPKLVEELTKDHLDIALAYRIPDTFDVTVVAQNYVTPCLLVPISHPFAKRRFVDVCECADLELAVPDETLTIRESYVRMFEKARIRPKVTLVTNSFELMRTAATVGLCSAIVNQFFGVTTVPRGLRYVPLRGEGVEKWSVSLFVHSGRSLPVAARRFLERMKAAMEEAEEP